MQPFDDPNRLYIAAIADTLREKPTNPAPEKAQAPDPVAKFSGLLLTKRASFYTVHFNQVARDPIIPEPTEAEKRRQNPAYAAYREKTHDRHMQDTYNRQGAGKFALEFDKETEAKILEVIKSFKIPEPSELPKYPEPPKFTDRYFDECYDLWKFPKTLQAAFSQSDKPKQAPAAKPAEPVFDFDAGRAAVNQFSGGARVRKIDPSNKP